MAKHWSDIKVMNESELPEEHITNVHHRRCPNKDKPACKTIGHAIVRGNYFYQYYQCKCCYRVENIRFEKIHSMEAQYAQEHPEYALEQYKEIYLPAIYLLEHPELPEHRDCTIEELLTVYRTKVAEIEQRQNEIIEKEGDK